MVDINVFSLPASNDVMPSYGSNVSFISQHIHSRELTFFLWENGFSVGVDERAGRLFLEIISLNDRQEKFDDSSNENEKYRFSLNSPGKILVDDTKKINEEGEPFCETNVNSNQDAILLLEKVEELVSLFIKNPNIEVQIGKKYAEVIRQIINMK